MWQEIKTRRDRLYVKLAETSVEIENDGTACSGIEPE
jgi:hypothetical protein